MQSAVIGFVINSFSMAVNFYFDVERIRVWVSAVFHNLTNDHTIETAPIQRNIYHLFICTLYYIHEGIVACCTIISSIRHRHIALILFLFYFVDFTPVNIIDNHQLALICRRERKKNHCSNIGLKVTCFWYRYQWLVRAQSSHFTINLQRIRIRTLNCVRLTVVTYSFRLTSYAKFSSEKHNVFHSAFNINIITCFRISSIITYTFRCNLFPSSSCGFSFCYCFAILAYVWQH